MSTSVPRHSMLPATRPTDEDEEDDDRRSSVSRLVALGDGIFAFAMTLLIVSVLPLAGQFGPSPSNQKVLDTLWSTAFLDPLLSFVLSFYTIGLAWQAHRWLFRYIVKVNARLFWLDLTVLLLIAFLPFPTALVGQYAFTPVVDALYGGMLAGIRLLLVLIWWTAASHHRLIRPTLAHKRIDYVTWRTFLPLPVYLLSIGLAFISPYLAMAAWLSTFLTLKLVDRRYAAAEW